jgi:hypothetical protein
MRGRLQESQLHRVRDHYREMETVVNDADSYFHLLSSSVRHPCWKHCWKEPIGQDTSRGDDVSHTIFFDTPSPRVVGHAFLAHH